MFIINCCVSIQITMLVILLLVFSVVSCEKSCYWNRKCAHDLFSSKTPYESVRGDIRDQVDAGCKAISLWSLHRHGNRNPSSRVTQDIKILQSKLHKEVIKEVTKQGSKNCFQDIEDLVHWTWNSSLDNSIYYLTGIGYEEVFDLGKRINNKYTELLMVPSDKVYFRSTNEQRTSTSARAFVSGLNEGTGNDFTDSIQESLERDDVIRPYEYCEKYQNEVKKSKLLTDELSAYDSSTEFLAVRDRVQAKLNIEYQLTSDDVYNLYELCRFERSWNQKLRSPWCSFFSDHDLMVLEYRDDVRHYYRNGYGSTINAKLGALPLKDLYKNFVNAVGGNGKNVVSYFTHDTALEMVFCALGLYKDPQPIRGAEMNASRLWRTSETAAFAVNFIAVLYRCEESGVQTHRVQLLINEKPTSLCPENSCTWEQFVEIFQVFSNADLDFCTYDTLDSSPSSSSSLSDKIRRSAIVAAVAKLILMR